jgi:hypothetical protein
VLLVSFDGIRKITFLECSAYYGVHSSNQFNYSLSIGVEGALRSRSDKGIKPQGPAVVPSNA